MVQNPTGTTIFLEQHFQARGSYMLISLEWIIGVVVPTPKSWATGFLRSGPGSMCRTTVALGEFRELWELKYAFSSCANYNTDSIKKLARPRLGAISSLRQRAVFIQ